jgi:uncharacterized delta-60 repeat protein
MAVARLLPNGALDPSFGPGTGKRTVFFDLSTTDKRDIALAVAVDRLGRIYLAGSAQLDAPPYSRAGFARLDASGGDDLTFGNFGNGRARFMTLDNVLDVASGAVVQDDNRLVASGTTAPGTARKVSALRLTESGALDSTWGGGFGVVAYDVYYSGAPDSGTAVALQGGRAVVAGYASVSNISTDTNFVVMRLDATLAFEDDFELGDSKRWSASGP